MNDPGDHIQVPPDASSSRAAFDLPPGPPSRGTLGSLVFGALAGIPMAALAGAAFCCLTEVTDSVWPGAFIGALVGPFGGMGIAFAERKIRGELTRPDIATIIGICFGILFAPLFILGAGAVGGQLSGLLLIGGLFVGPMAGMIIGAMLDRAHEASIQKAWGSAGGFATATIALCVGFMLLLEYASTPGTDQVAEDARRLILEDWNFTPGVKELVIKKVTVVHQSGKKYTGTVDGTINGVVQHSNWEAEYRHGMIQWRLFPRDEKNKEPKE